MKRINFVCLFLCLTAFAGRPAHAQTETVLHSFCYEASQCPYDTDGMFPEAGLASDGAGNLYGTTFYGGTGDISAGGGTVFEVSPDGNGGWDEELLYSFCSVNSPVSCADGEGPYFSNVIFDSAGNLYGTTEMGGADGLGVVFELSPSEAGWTETVLHSFGTEADDCEYPVNGLAMDPAGNLYGKATYSCVFELSPSGSGWTYQVIYGGGSDGSNYGGLYVDAGGNIFGTTDSTVFELTPNGDGGWTSSVIHSFAGGPKDGSSAQSAPVSDEAGNLYGTTETGGSKGYGVVYKLTPVVTGKKNGTWTEKILYSFGGSKLGQWPWAGVVLDAAGNIYGTTQYGGKFTTCSSTYGCGTVFELVAPVGTAKAYKEKVLWNFNSIDGYSPLGNLIFDSAGNLYGTTFYGGLLGQIGGTQGEGVVFELNPSGTATTTTTALTSSPNPSTSGDAVTFTAVVTPAPLDGETVTFEHGTTVLGTGVLSGGSASFTTSTLPVGTTTVKAVYGGDGDFDASTSNTVKQVVKE